MMQSKKEAEARIKINKLLENAGWRFFDNEDGRANIQCEQVVALRDIDAFGKDFEHTKNGYVDFRLNDRGGFPLAVLEAKREDKNPLDGKEQARRYAWSLNVRFVLLSNGNQHYFWDLERGNPKTIITFPTQELLISRQELKQDNKCLSKEVVTEDYIALTQESGFKDDPQYKDPKTRTKYLYDKGLRLLRPYQVDAVAVIQKSVAEGKDSFLLEMATGTGKTIIAAAIIKLFLRTANVKRVLFLVDRLELEKQAYKNFTHYLGKNWNSVIYKDRRNDWKKAVIVISTIQTLARNNKYKKFSSTDFDLVISDEAHRSIGGDNAREVFEYFWGYKLGLTATPKDYLKNIDPQKLLEKDPRALERRQLLDTYTTFGCESGEPTYRYTLNQGVKEGYLVNLYTVDVRTDVTTELLTKEGYHITVIEEGEEIEEQFYQKDFEKRFFSENTNRAFCKTILKHAKRDPINGEIGKTIVFCVSQNHASKIMQILNEMAAERWPGKYSSDFAVQVTSNIDQAQQYSINFVNNNLNGRTGFSPDLPNYKSSKTRVCVTVRMMTTGYDCEDILNLALMRPIFSPTDFVQIKGRGTRKFTFKNTDKEEPREVHKDTFKLFDFFANCKYFDKEFKYDEPIPLRQISKETGEQRNGVDDVEVVDKGPVEIFTPDDIKSITETRIGPEGMKVDRKLFERAKNEIQKDREVKIAVEQEWWDKAIRLTRERYEDKPELYITLEKIRRDERLDRRITWREVLERIFGIIDYFKSKDEKLTEEIDNFILDCKPEHENLQNIRNYFKCYVTDVKFREIIDSKEFAKLSGYAGFTMKEFKELSDYWRKEVPEYIKNYVNLNQYME